MLTLSVLLQLSTDDWRWIILAIAIVWVAEAFNTAIERLCDAVTVERDENIGYAKDVAAGGVLMAAIAAALIGLTIFAPKLERVFGW